MNWKELWIKMFGTSEWLNIDIGFWVSMGMSLLVALVMVIVFWSLKPYNKDDKK